MTDVSVETPTWERYWTWESIVSMLRLQPGVWVPIGSGILDAELERDITAKVHAADHRADAAVYEVRSSGNDRAPEPVEARITTA